MRTKLLAFAVLAFFAAVADAQDDPCASPAGAKALETAALSRGYDFALRAARICLGSLKGDDAPVVVKFNQATPDAKDALSRKQHIHDALEALERHAQSRAQSSQDHEQWTIVQVRLGDEIALLENLDDLNSPGNTFLAQRFWPGVGDASGIVADGVIDLLAPTGCAQAPAPCAAYDARKDLIRVFNLAERLGRYAQADMLVVHLKDAELQNTRWKSYFNDTVPQYWWEIMINGQLMKKEDCADDPNTHIQRGFCRVPTHQWIVLHPSAALQWVNGADGQDDLKAAFIVEVFGRNSWNWNGGTANGQRGWALLGAYSNRGTGQNKWSYGLMLHFGKDMNLGFTTTSDNEFGLLVSARLAGRFFEQRQAYADYLKAQEKGSPLALID